MLVGQKFIGGAGVVVAVLAQAEKYAIELLPHSVADSVQVERSELLL